MTPKPSPARHAAWLLPTIACVGLAMLIGGGLAVRQVVVLMRRPPLAEVRADAVAAVVEPASTVENAPPLPSIDLPPSSEPGLEVLPPLAARTPGRTLAKMLVVGAGPGMFTSLDEALAVTIRGDVIELRGEGPFRLGKLDLTFEPDPAARPILIRAGQGFRPVLRATFPPKRHAVVHVRNADVALEGLHLATGKVTPSFGFPFLFHMEAGEFAARGCSLTRVVGGPDGGNPMLVHLGGPDTAATLEGCLFRGNGTARLTGTGTRLRCERCAWLYGGAYAVDIGGNDRQAIEILGCTFIATTFANKSLPAGVESGDADPPRIEFRQNVFVSPWMGFYFMKFAPQKNRRSDPTLAEGVALAASSLSMLAANDNLVQFWEDKYALGGYLGTLDDGSQPSLPMFAPLGPPVKGIAFGPGMSAITAAVFRGDFRGDSTGLLMAFRSLGPTDLLMRSKDPTTAALLATARYGADPRLLPDPPPLAAQAFDPPDSPTAD